MSIWFKDKRKEKQACITALTAYKKHGDLDRSMLDLDVALDEVSIKKAEAMRRIGQLMRTNNVDRAVKLLNHAIDNYEPRIWWVIPFTIISWPFRLVWRVIKLGLPG